MVSTKEVSAQDLKHADVQFKIITKTNISTGNFQTLFDRSKFKIAHRVYVPLIDIR